MLPRATAGVRPVGRELRCPTSTIRRPTPSPPTGPPSLPENRELPSLQRCLRLPLRLCLCRSGRLPLLNGTRPPGHRRRPACRRFVRSAPLDVHGRPLASWLKRALAIAVDFLVLSFALSWFGHQVFPLVLSSTVSSPPEGQVVSFLGVSALVWVGYLALLGSSRRGQTLGMMLYGIAVRDDADGGQVSVARERP